MDWCFVRKVVGSSMKDDNLVLCDRNQAKFQFPEEPVKCSPWIKDNVCLVGHLSKFDNTIPQYQEITLYFCWPSIGSSHTSGRKKIPNCWLLSDLFKRHQTILSNENNR